MSFLQKGKEKERLFASLFESTTESTREEDMFLHWDIKIPVDVKGIKKINRGDREANENFHYVELRNVNGKKGWIYGEAMYFAFETTNYWILVGKRQLQELIAVKCAKKRLGRDPYELRTRAGRKDLITIVPTLDLCYISTEIISKK